MDNDLIFYEADSKFTLRETAEQACLGQLKRAAGAVVNHEFTTDTNELGFDYAADSENTTATTHPLQSYSVGFCLGRKDRLRAVFSFLAQDKGVVGQRLPSTPSWSSVNG